MAINDAHNLFIDTARHSIYTLTENPMGMDFSGLNSLFAITERGIK